MFEFECWVLKKKTRKRKEKHAPHIKIQILGKMKVPSHLHWWHVWHMKVNGEFLKESFVHFLCLIKEEKKYEGISHSLCSLWVIYVISIIFKRKKKANLFSGTEKFSTSGVGVKKQIHLFTLYVTSH